MKNFIDTTGNQTSDFPACSAVPQPTAPPRDPTEYVYTGHLQVIFKKISEARNFIQLFTKTIRYNLILLTQTDRPFNISVAMSMVFAAEPRRSEGQIRRLNSTSKKLNFYKIPIWQALANNFQNGRAIF